MKVKFAVIVNNISDYKFNQEFGESILNRLRNGTIKVEGINLFDLIGIGKMPHCLDDWATYHKVVIIADSTTATFFLDVYKAISNAELWIYNWPRKISGTDRPDKHKFFDNDDQVIAAAKNLVAEEFRTRFFSQYRLYGRP